MKPPNNKSLLVLSPLLPGESLPSLLYRLADVNSYHHSQHQVISLCQERLTAPDNIIHSGRAETFNVISELTGIELETLYQASIHHFAPVIAPSVRKQVTMITLPSGQTVPVLPDIKNLHRLFYLESDAQYCPLCLKEDVCHRLIWFLKTTAVCLAHRCLLVRGCPECKGEIAVKDVVRGRCPDCDFVLADARTVDVSSDDFGLFSQTVIQSWLGLTPPPENTPLPDKPPALLYNILYDLGLTISRIDSDWPQFHHPDGVPFVSSDPPGGDYNPVHPYCLYATAFKALLDWPQGLHNLFDAYCHSHPPYKSTTSPPLDLGGFYTLWNTLSWRQPEFQFVQDAFDDYLTSRYLLTPSVAHLRRIQHNPALKTRFPYVSVTQVGHILGVKPLAVQRMISLGLLTRYEPEDDDTWAGIDLVRQAEVTELRRKWHEPMPLPEIAYLLGIPESVVGELIEGGLWESDRPTYEVVITFLGDLCSCIHPPPRCISIVPVFDFEAGVDPVQLLHSILARKVRGYWSAETMSLTELTAARKDVEGVKGGILPASKNSR